MHTSSGTPDVIHQTRFALDVKALTLPLYETLFDVEYPLPKLDTLVVSRQLFYYCQRPERKYPGK
jgi:hypothetical protein